MSVIAEFTIPAGAFALGETFDRVPDVTIEVERLATHSREWVMPFLWLTNAELDPITAALEADQSVIDFEFLDSEDDIGYFNVHWDEAVQERVDEIIDQHGILQEATAADGRWFFKLKFVDKTALEGFQRYFQDKEYSFELQRIYDGTAPKEREYDLTSAQRDVLVTGLEMGYFNVPRDAQIGDLATELDISTNAVSQRLRRATKSLTQNTLVVSTEQTKRGLDESN
ncbi:helix-turn-helix domain-containing protein [Natrialba asiatica]|uniref:Bacterio-opsin activator HTH domain-containing protein n=1 Tax=Natrialba asiatica (strain ATCC 700177 / DSM 12278 / JCM 9576 / FERM P-10747 / NBRC 102637 / 172P1) TaxID=29540 RepID=M0AZS9_NATA1|nr:helix-turn-helix domain-containing protein [Natrialba asiatica]ELZ03473.1 bacterio-opsin activator HTH domain-containing protein [Natrialba asiatica DSM 12278]